jgi:hypothetical protein
MKDRRHFSGKLVVFAGISLAAMLLVACDQSQQSASAPAGTAPQAASTKTIYVQFEGPWAFAPDPKDANSVIAIAPKAKGHHDLFVKASNDKTLASGIYDLSVPAQAGAAGAIDPAIIQAQISPANLQHAIDAKGARYVIRLPKPEAYVPAGRAESRVGDTYPPPASTQGGHVTAVSLRYSVNSLTGITLAGTPDTGTLNPLLLQVETTIIRVVIEPAQLDDVLDHCETHSRESFRDLVKLLGVALYVDFPDYTDACHKSDAQRASNAAPRSLLNWLAAALNTNLLDSDTQTASLARAELVPAPLRFSAREGGHPLMAAIYLFSHGGADCKAPLLVLHF